MQMIAQPGGCVSAGLAQAMDARGRVQKNLKRTTLHQMVTLKKFLSTRSQPDKNEHLNVFS